ncbi:MAG TPA: sigma 54-interacting transcriptional regulator, partial [Chthoniobacterales bacterium]|nr:sigma 54-interacting transcriptional regulator [Chthoniobacterales bacterium]
MSRHFPQPSAVVRPAISVMIVCAPDTDVLADSLERLLAETEGFTCRRSEYSPESGIKPRPSGDPDVVIVTLGDSPALDLASLFESLHRAFPNRPVLVTTTQPDAIDILKVLEMGASDFFMPPVRRSELVARLMRQARVTHRGDALVQELKEKIGLKQIIGESPLLLEQVQRVPRFARCDATVLISGESGTGKEIFARAIHYLSP